MTATINNVVYDELGAEVKPGTLCWVQTDSTVPALVRNRRAVAVYCRGAAHHYSSSQDWLLLIPKSDDEYATASEEGWRIEHHVTRDLMRDLNIERFIGTHRGWWPGTGARFTETCTGHWCTEHQVFHATETCPPSDEPERFANLTRIAELERQLNQARADVEQARIQGEQNLEAFKVRVSERLASAASAHDLCSVYDEEAEEAGLYPRMQNQDVEIEVTYRTTITIPARDWESAAEIIRGRSASSYYSPPSPFADDSDIEIGGTYSLDINIVD